MTPRQVINVMRGFAMGLGVRCEHCHVGEPGQPLGSFDFVSDEKPTKEKARDTPTTSPSSHSASWPTASPGDHSTAGWTSNTFQTLLRVLNRQPTTSARNNRLDRRENEMKRALSSFPATLIGPNE